jgi:hypothetical protein
LLPRRDGLLVDTMVTLAGGTMGREAALLLQILYTVRLEKLGCGRVAIRVSGDTGFTQTKSKSAPRQERKRG